MRCVFLLREDTSLSLWTQEPQNSKSPKSLVSTSKVKIKDLLRGNLINLEENVSSNKFKKSVRNFRFYIARNHQTAETCTRTQAQTCTHTCRLVHAHARASQRECVSACVLMFKHSSPRASYIILLLLLFHAFFEEINPYNFMHASKLFQHEWLKLSVFACGTRNLCPLFAAFMVR